MFLKNLRALDGTTHATCKLELICIRIRADHRPDKTKDLLESISSQADYPEETAVRVIDEDFGHTEVDIFDHDLNVEIEDCRDDAPLVLHVQGQEDMGNGAEMLQLLPEGERKLSVALQEMGVNSSKEAQGVPSALIDGCRIRRSRWKGGYGVEQPEGQYNILGIVWGQQRVCCTARHAEGLDEVPFDQGACECRAVDAKWCRIAQERVSKPFDNVSPVLVAHKIVCTDKLVEQGQRTKEGVDR